MDAADLTADSHGVIVAHVPHRSRSTRRRSSVKSRFNPAPPPRESRVDLVVFPDGSTTATVEDVPAGTLTVARLACGAGAR